MNIYLPIAEMSVNVFLLLAIGAAGGFMSGMFGVGGGFLLTPLLTFAGVPPFVAVGTQASQMVGTSLSGAIAHWQKRNVDVRMGLAMMIGSFAGTTLGAMLFQWLQKLGQINLVISLGYVVMLGGIGTMMLFESGGSLWKKRRASRKRAEGGEAGKDGKITKSWGADGILAMDFPASRLRINLLVPICIGFMGGVLVSMLGIGGGFVMVPAMIYVLRMPFALVNGTSLFQIIFTTAFATLLQAVLNNSVDIILAMALLSGSVIGVPLGARMSGKVNPDTGRFLLALTIVVVVGKMLFELVSLPDQLFVLETRLPR